ncbi:MAG TPA: dTMP kinase [Candidatus Tumulicola sp.]|nr:dTMP kinase [Candidatus Tumulicola sp.]
MALHRCRAQSPRASVQGVVPITSGLFVTFEGIEGAGKSTQVKLLHEYLAQTTIPFIFTREPGGTPLGEKLRELLIDPLGQISPEAETLLLSSSRAELVDKVIEPALAEGRLVVCDRFWDATLAYQGFGRGIPVDTIMRITRFAARGLAPDVTFLLNISTELSRERLHIRPGFGDRMERESTEFHSRVAEGYRKVAVAEGGRFIVLEGSLPADEIASQVREVVLSRWQSR